MNRIKVFSASNNLLEVWVYEYILWTLSWLFRVLKLYFSTSQLLEK